MDISGASILVVEDNRVNRALSVKILESAGAHAYGVDGEQGALEFLDAEPCHLIILDIQLEDASGIDLLRLIRDNPNYSDLPVIMLTGSREKQDIKDSRALGVVEYLLKPIDAKTLIERAQEALLPY